MNDDRDLAGRLVVGLEGPLPTAAEWSWLQKWTPAGVILFSRNIQSAGQLKDLCGLLRQGRPDLVVCADHEGGAVSQVAAALGRPPSAYTLGTLDDPDLTRRVFAETGRRLAWAGVDLLLAPCADVLSEPRNPVIGARSFGADPGLVARHVAAAVTGLLESGVRPCLKHWPGHGGAALDSHQEAPRVEITPGEEEVFRAGMAAGARDLMPGHLLVDGAKGEPATLSPDLLAQARRRFLPGGGLRLVADDVSMGALRGPMESRGIVTPGDPGDGMLDPARLPREWLAALLDAGSDLLLVRGIPTEALPVGADGTAPRPGERVAEEPDFDDTIYAEVRHRARPFSGEYLAGDLTHLDLAAGDRWQVAVGTGSLQQRLLEQNLDAVFSERSVSYQVQDPDPAQGFRERLLITSHRPLPDGWQGSRWFADLLPRLRTRGLCLVMGHPSLEKDLATFLPRDWEVGACHDITWPDLEGR